jgi:hypothetical protein
MFIFLEKVLTEFQIHIKLYRISQENKLKNSKKNDSVTGCYK